MPPPRTLVGVAGALCLGVPLVLMFPSAPPEVGPLETVEAAAPEWTEEIRLRPGQTFGEVLGDAAVNWNEQNELLLAFREQANPRRMRDGTRIMLRRLVGEDRLRGVDVDLSSDETVRLLRDEAAGWSAELVVTPVLVDTLFVSGVVQSSLSQAVTQNASLGEVTAPNREWIVSLLDQVFQWQIDFSRQVRTGDQYRFVVEREVRPDGTMKDGHLIAAEYMNQGTAYRAIWFDPNGDGDGTFYGEDGKSVRRAFLMKPIELSRISSRYSNARLHPVLNTVRAHRGVDFAANSGTPIMATGDGVVIFAGPKGDLGNLVEIRHPNGWVTRYGHQSRFAKDLRAGTRVRQSQIIGYVGSTGLATGPHLHYEMRRRDGSSMDPMSVQLPPGDPVAADAWGRWVLESRERLGLLERLPGAPILRMVEGPEPDSLAGSSATGG